MDIICQFGQMASEKLLTALRGIAEGDNYLTRVLEQDAPKNFYKAFFGELAKRGFVDACAEILSLGRGETSISYTVHCAQFLMMEGKFSEGAALSQSIDNGKYGIDVRSVARITMYLPSWAPPVLHECSRELEQMSNKFATSGPVECHTMIEPHLIYLQEDMQLFRYTSNPQSGSVYYTNDKYNTREEARDSLAVDPEWNTMEYLASYIIHAPAFILAGYASRIGDLKGGGRQFIIPNAARKTQIFVRPFPG